MQTDIQIPLIELTLMRDERTQLLALFSIFKLSPFTEQKNWVRAYEGRGSDLTFLSV